MTYEDEEMFRSKFVFNVNFVFNQTQKLYIYGLKSKVLNNKL